MHFSRKIKRLTVAATLIGALLGGGSLIASSSADLQSQIQANKSAASSLQGEINSESTQIEKTAGGVAAAQQRLSIEQTDLNLHITALREVQTQLMDARDRLLALETKLRIASTDLASNLRAAYENGSPNLIDVILNAHGFSNLLEQVNYIKDAQHQDAQVVNYTKIARAEVLKEATHLGKLELQDRDLTSQILSQRNQVAAIEIGLAKQQIDEESQRSHDTAKLASVNSSTQALQQKLAQQERAVAAREAAAAAAARQTPEQVNQQVGGLAIDTGGMVQPPPGAPAAVGRDDRRRQRDRDAALHLGRRPRLLHLPRLRLLRARSATCSPRPGCSARRRPPASSSPTATRARVSGSRSTRTPATCG